jgi:DNA-binding ferritin-like protein (Dps family)
MANIGRLTVDLTLASQKFEAGVKRVNARVTAMRRHFAAATKTMGGMQAKVLGLVGVAGLGLLINKTLKSADSLAKMSDRLGIATEDLAAYHHLTQLNGESSESFDKSLTKMTRTVGEFERGFGTGKKAFEQLGISIEDLQGKNPSEQFQIIGDSISTLGSKSQQASVAADIFGRSGINLLNTINQGSEGFERARAEVEKYGLALSRVDGAKIEAANDAILRSQQAINGVVLKATVQLAPVMEVVANRFTEAAIQGEGFGSKVESVFNSVAGFVGVFADGIHGIKVILKAVESGAIGFGAVWTNVFEFLINDVMVRFANSITNFVLAPIRSVLEFAAQFSDEAQGMLDSMNALGKAEGFDSLRNLASDMSDNFESSQAELQALMLSTIPSVQMKEALAEIFEEAAVKAEEIAKTVQEKLATTGTELVEPEKKTKDKTKDETQDKSSELTQEKGHLDKMAALQIGNSKKVAAVQKAIKLKTALVNGFLSISEAVASAPFPLNIPAVVYATASSAANVAGISGVGSFIGGGYIKDGPRALGVDGKGGQMHILHPDESIIDHKKQGSQGGGSMSFSFAPVINSRRPGDIISELETVRKPLMRMIQSAIKEPI